MIRARREGLDIIVEIDPQRLRAGPRAGDLPEVVLSGPEAAQLAGVLAEMLSALVFARAMMEH